MELLADNGPSFKAFQFVDACSSWGVRVIYRCAFRTQMNGVVELNHRTVKRMAARVGRDPLDMVFFYNLPFLAALMRSQRQVERFFVTPGDTPSRKLRQFIVATLRWLSCWGRGAREA